jgi:hypothetical protein
MALSTARAQEQLLHKKGLSLYRRNCSLTPPLAQEYAELTSDVFPDFLASCSTALRRIKDQVRTIADQSFEQRDKERDELIEKLDQSSLSSDQKRATLLQKIRYSEKSRQLALMLKSVRTTQASVGMRRIEIPVHPEQDPKTMRTGPAVDRHSVRGLASSATEESQTF